MDVSTIPIAGAECWVSRSGYTGDDGFEISIPSQAAEIVTTSLLKHETVELAGLGARDSLRLKQDFVFMDKILMLQPLQLPQAEVGHA